MNSKVAVVTGANKGIGFAIVRGLCKRFNGVVYLTSRNEKRRADTLAALNKEGLHPHCHQLDITDVQSVTKFHDYLKEKYVKIDILVNNAGIAFKNNATEPVAVQAEETLKVNYFAVLSTCEILFSLLRNGARVINISSSSGHLSCIPSNKLKQRFQDPNLSITELSDLMHQYIEAAKQGGRMGIFIICGLQSRVNRFDDDKDVKVNAVYPGYMNTDLSSHEGPLSIDEGAQAPLYIALDAPDSVKGEYVWYDNQIVSWTGDLPAENYLRFHSYQRLDSIVVILTFDVAARNSVVVLHPNLSRRFFSQEAPLLAEEFLGDFSLEY